MNTTVILVAALGAFLCANARAQDTPAEPAYSEGELLALADQLAKCSGVYEAGAQTTGEVKGPATAEAAHQLANGYAMVAEFLLAQNDVLKGKKNVTLGDYGKYVDDLAAVEKTRILALLENVKGDEMLGVLKLCEALSPVEQELMKSVRKLNLPK